VVSRGVVLMVLEVVRKTSGKELEISWD